MIVPANPSIVEVIWAAILSAAVVAAVVTQVAQAGHNWIKRRNEVEDRKLKRSAEREDRIFDAKRQALVGYLQAVDEAYLLLMNERKPSEARLSEVMTRSNDATVEARIYLDPAASYQAERLFHLAVFSTMTWQDQFVQPAETRSIQRQSFVERRTRIGQIFQAELGITETASASESREEVEAEYGRFLELSRQASEQGIEVTHDTHHSKATLNPPTPFP